MNPKTDAEKKIFIMKPVSTANEMGNPSKYNFLFSFWDLQMNHKLIIGFSLLLLLGCNQSGNNPTLVTVRGEVTYEGKPIHEGVIRLSPMKGNQAPARTTQIIKGLYKFSERSAVKPGTYQVEIEGYRGGSSLPGDKTKDSPEREQFLPEQFNKKTQIEELTVNSDSGEIQKDFNLK